MQLDHQDQLSTAGFFVFFFVHHHSLTCNRIIRINSRLLWAEAIVLILGLLLLLLRGHRGLRNLVLGKVAQPLVSIFLGIGKADQFNLVLMVRERWKKRKMHQKIGRRGHITFPLP